MEVYSAGIAGGVIADRFGKRGEQFDSFGRPSRSLPFSVQDAPEGTRSFAFLLEDKDAIPVCGYSWIHWTGANLTEPSVPENASLTGPSFVQGTTSWSGKLSGRERMAVSSYGGMAPPDRPHLYELHVYALDTLLPLAQGFYANELYHAMQGHILAQATLSGWYAD